MALSRTQRSAASASSSAPSAAQEGKARALQMAMAQIEKQFGKGAVMRFGDGPQVQVPVIPTGSIRLDAALGINGWPRGRVVEIYGPEASGKTTLTLQAIAQVQKAGGTAAFVDAEHALDPIYARQLGVNIDELLVSQPDTAEQALEIVSLLVDSGAVDIVVIDSVAALTPRAEIEGEMGALNVGLQARLMSQALRKLTGRVSQTQTTVIFINQLRMKIGMMMPGQSPETTTGGNALKFYASIRIDIRRIGSVKSGDAIIGNQVKIKVVKNKMAPPFRQVITDIIFGKGISRHGELIDMGVELKLIDKAGAWYSYGKERIGQGKEQSRAFLEENEAISNEIEARIKQALTGNVLDLIAPEGSASEDEEDA